MREFRPIHQYRPIEDAERTVHQARPGFLKPVWYRRWKVLVLAALPVAIGATLIGLRARQGSAGDGDSLIVTIKRGDLEVVVLETGRVEPLLQTQIKSKVGGQITEVLVREGEQVKKGQSLLRIDAIDYDREVARARAEVDQAREVVAFASERLSEVRGAHKVGVAPGRELPEARHEAALARMKLKTAEVALEVARDRLSYTDIRAPFDGTVIQRNAQPGEVVTPGMTATVEGRPLLVVADMSAILVKTDLNQIDVSQLKNGQRAEVSIDAFPGRKLVAVVTRVSPASITVNGRDAFPVDATLDPKQDLTDIKPGMSAEVRVVIEKRAKVLLSPIEAITAQGDASYVQVVSRRKDGIHIQEREVRLGARNDREVELLGGVPEGTEVRINPPARKD